MRNSTLDNIGNELNNTALTLTSKPALTATLSQRLRDTFSMRPSNEIEAYRTTMENSWLTNAETDLKNAQQALIELNHNRPGSRPIDIIFGTAFVLSVIACPWLGALALGLTSAVNTANIVGSCLCHISSEQTLQQLIKVAQLKLEIIRDLIATMNNCYRERLQAENRANDSTVFGFLPATFREGKNACAETIKGIIVLTICIAILAVLWKFLIQDNQSLSKNISQMGR